MNNFDEGLNLLNSLNITDPIVIDYCRAYFLIHNTLPDDIINDIEFQETEINNTNNTNNLNNTNILDLSTDDSSYSESDTDSDEPDINYNNNTNNNTNNIPYLNPINLIFTNEIIIDNGSSESSNEININRSNESSDEIDINSIRPAEFSNSLNSLIQTLNTIINDRANNRQLDVIKILDDNEFNNLHCKLLKINDEKINEMCEICMDDFIVNDLIRILPCNHSYHKSCIDYWLSTTSCNCPNGYCKKQVGKHKYLNL